jgi:geranylgeranyl diphosphate synthase type II
MDNDDYRRGRLTNHKVYGEAMAVLAGDALLTAAFTHIGNADLSDTQKIRAVRVLSECAGEIGMVGGQVLDMQSEERQCTPQEVMDIQIRKTGALINAACCLGALAGDATEGQFEAAGVFAANLGLAFQIRDDMLDVVGDAQELGKAVGVDTNKNTFVRLYGMEKCEKLVQTYTANALEALSVFADTEFLVSLAKSLTDRTK